MMKNKAFKQNKAKVNKKDKVKNKWHQKIKNNWKITENLHTINVTSKNTRKAKIAKKTKRKRMDRIAKSIAKICTI